MGNARNVSNKIWRTVVVAGAMLGTPACGGGTKPTPVAPGPTVEEQKAADEQKAANDAAAKAEAESTAAAKSAEDARLLAEKEAADAAAKEAADKAAADAKAAEEAKKRPRGGGQKPVGRGFVLA